MKKTKIIFSVVAAVLVVIDQIIKKWAMDYLMGVGSVTVIPGFFNLTYVENRGAAFGIFQGNSRLLAIITAFAMLAILVAVYAGFIKEKFAVCTILIIVGGGVGNLIDRVIMGYVVDYLDFSAVFGFPVFNFADCCVVVGAVLLMIYMLIFDKKAEKEKAAPKGEA